MSVATAQPAVAASRQEVTFEFTARQEQAYGLLLLAQVLELLFGGAKGGGKSWFLCVWCYARAIEIIKQFNLQPSEYPLAIAFMGRKQSVDFTNTTLETWKQIIPSESYHIREQDKEIVIADTVKIDFGGMDREENIQKFNSAEYAFFALDQAEEITEDEILALRASLRLAINGKHPAYKGLMTANPAACWLKPEFILAPAPDRRFIPALPGDNPHLPEGYADKLKYTYRHRPELLEAYLFGSWDSFEGVDQVIRDLWVQAARDRKFHIARPHKLVVCDPARFGDDETVIYDMTETQIAREEVYGKKDLMYTANRLFVHAKEHGGDDGPCPIALDITGLGAGAADRLKEMGAEVIAIESAAKSSDPDKYGNFRAEMWNKAALMFSDGDIALQHESLELAAQLCTPKYHFRAGRMFVESKEEIKKRLNRSPDHADTYVMGLAALIYLREGEHGMPAPGMVVYEKPSLSPKPDPYSYAGRDAMQREAEEKATKSRW